VAAIGLSAKLPSLTEIRKVFLMSRNKLGLANFIGDNSFIYNNLTSFLSMYVILYI
jgi:hypothetical protein